MKCYPALKKTSDVGKHLWCGIRQKNCHRHSQDFFFFLSHEVGGEKKGRIVATLEQELWDFLNLLFFYFC